MSNKYRAWYRYSPKREESDLGDAGQARKAKMKRTSRATATAQQPSRPPSRPPSAPGSRLPSAAPSRATSPPMPSAPKPARDLMDAAEGERQQPDAMQASIGIIT
ncbi:hypothetical protein MRX96_044562 [Rhipicephalus microplus]